MSDTSQGPGWWEASDGKWYPPEQQPGQPAADAGSVGTYQQAPGHGTPQAPQPGYPQQGYQAPGFPAPGYGAPAYGYVPGQQFSNGLGTAGMVLGIIALVLFWTVWLGILLGLLATIFGGVGISKANKGEANNKGMAVAGLVCGIIAIAIDAIFWIAVVSAVNNSRY